MVVCQLECKFSEVVQAAVAFLMADHTITHLHQLIRWTHLVLVFQAVVVWEWVECHQLVCQDNLLSTHIQAGVHQQMQVQFLHLCECHHQAMEGDLRSIHILDQR